MPKERRPTPRFKSNISIGVRKPNSAGAQQKVERLNVSERGLCFATASSYRQGDQLELILRMPEEIVGVSRQNWHCFGRVVHTRALDFSCRVVGWESRLRRPHRLIKK
jgi:hypothetical protein